MEENWDSAGLLAPYSNLATFHSLSLSREGLSILSMIKASQTSLSSPPTIINQGFQRLLSLCPVVMVICINTCTQVFIMNSPSRNQVFVHGLWAVWSWSLCIRFGLTVRGTRAHLPPAQPKFTSVCHWVLDLSSFLLISSWLSPLAFTYEFLTLVTSFI